MAETHAPPAERRGWTRNLPSGLGYWAGAVASTAAWGGLIGAVAGYPAGVHLTLTALPLVGAAWGHSMGFSRRDRGRAEEGPENSVPPASLVVHARIPPRQAPAPMGLPRWRIGAGYAAPVQVA